MEIGHSIKIIKVYIKNLWTSLCVKKTPMYTNVDIDVS